jgi:hypothetical protein
MSGCATAGASARRERTSPGLSRALDDLLRLERASAEEVGSWATWAGTGRRRSRARRRAPEETRVESTVAASAALGSKCMARFSFTPGAGRPFAAISRTARLWHRSARRVRWQMDLGSSQGGTHMRMATCLAALLFLVFGVKQALADEASLSLKLGELGRAPRPSCSLMKSTHFQTGRRLRIGMSTGKRKSSTPCWRRSMASKPATALSW